MDQVNYFRSHPPRCIASFISTQVAPPGGECDGPLSVFALASSCGSGQHFVHGFWWRNPDFHDTLVFLSPLSLECAACGKRTDLIDTDVHGYDGEVEDSATARGLRGPAVYECPKCGRQPLEVFAGLNYTDDLFDDDFVEFAGRQQDLFDWFSLSGKCCRCSQLLAVTDFECA